MKGDWVILWFFFVFNGPGRSHLPFVFQEYHLGAAQVVWSFQLSAFRVSQREFGPTSTMCDTPRLNSGHRLLGGAVVCPTSSLASMNGLLQCHEHHTPLRVKSYFCAVMNSSTVQLYSRWVEGQRFGPLNLYCSFSAMCQKERFLLAPDVLCFGIAILGI